MTTSRLSQDEWLERALRSVTAAGGARLRIDRLVKDLGVTKGSFYWHFRDRAHFVKCLLEYWERVHTLDVIAQGRSMTGTPEDRLMGLAENVVRNDHARYDLALRAWALLEPEVLPIMKRVDRARLEAVGALLAECGFTGDDLDTRARIFVTYFSNELALFDRETKAERLSRVRDRVGFLIRP